MQDGHKSCHFGTMADMVRCVTGLVKAVYRIIRATAYSRKSTQNQVMYTGHAFGGNPQAGFGKHHIVVNQCRAMSYFHEYILAHHSAFCLCGAFRRMIVMQQVLCDSRALRLPVTPDTHGRMMDMIAAECYVDSCMELNAGNLGAAELLHIVDIMNVVILNDTEYASHTSYNTSLFAMMDMAASYDMAAHFFPSAIHDTVRGTPHPSPSG